MTGTEADPRRVIRKLNLIGLSMVVVLIGGVGGWASTTQLAGAVIAPGTIVVESNVKKVQHPSGGVVGEILVKEGSEVKDGDVVLRLDDTVTRSTLGVVRSQLDETSAREARLLTERDDTDAIVFPARRSVSGHGARRRGEAIRVTPNGAGGAALAAARTYHAAERRGPRPVGAAGGKGKRARADRDGARRRRRSLQEKSRLHFALHA